MVSYNNIWIGLVHVSSLPNNDLLGNAKGAYVNVLALANNPNDFTNKVKESIIDLGLDFIELEDAELFSERIENYEVQENIKILATEVIKSKEVRFGDFHTYDD